MDVLWEQCQGSTLPCFSHRPCSAPHKAMQTMAGCCQQVKPWSTRPDKLWQALQKAWNLGQKCNLISSSCSKCYGHLQMISSPCFFRYLFSKFASIVQASQEYYRSAGHSQDITVISEKATAPWFSFQSRWKHCKSTWNLQQKGRKCKEKTRASPTSNQDGLLPAWVGGGGN